MQKILSVRVDESSIEELDRSARQLGLSKKQFIEEAIRLRAREAERRGAKDVWSETLGAWKRREPPASTVRAARQAFDKAFERHHGK